VTTYVRRPRPPLDVYTDGACSGAPGPGAWAWAADSGNIEDFGYEPLTTNQRMELRAAQEAIQTLGPRYRLRVHSDSAYLVNCFEQQWYFGWRKRKWRTSQGTPVSNRDIWEPLIEAALKYKATFVKVKGHSGNPGNDYVDRLAVQAKHNGMRHYA
jgi:ribonuclease HI